MYRAYHLSLYCTPFEELLKRKGEEWRGMERYRGLHLSFDCTPFEELLKRRGEEWRGKERDRQTDRERKRSGGGGQPEPRGRPLGGRARLISAEQVHREPQAGAAARPALALLPS